MISITPDGGGHTLDSTRMMQMRPRLKWHNCREAERRSLLASKSCGRVTCRRGTEVDLVVTADGHFLCLHDLTLDAETTGQARRWRPAPSGATSPARDQRRCPGRAHCFSTSGCHGVTSRTDSGGLTQLDIRSRDPFDDALAVQFARTIARAPSFHRQRLRRQGDRAPPQGCTDLTFGFDPLDLYNLGGSARSGYRGSRR